jgi:uncharacterized membrane protein
MFDFLFLISSILLLTIDYFYLNIIKGYFINQIKLVQGTPVQINYLGTALCYLLLIIGLNYFIIKPRKNINDAFLFGIIIYGVFETTNYALFKNWSILTVIMDTLWGGILFGIVTYLTYMIKNIF